MTDDAALFAAALAHPDADTPRLVLADWFDDHGEEELAWALRTNDDIIPFLADLIRWDRMPVAATIETRDGHIVNRWVSQYWAELLVRYRDQIPQPPGAPTAYDPDAGWTFIASAEQPGPGAFLMAWQAARRRQVAGLREAASRAAADWPQLSVTFPAGEDAQAVEMRAVLVHELVIRGHDLRVVDGWGAIWDDIATRSHPLFWLPPKLLPLEDTIPDVLPQYHSFRPFPVHATHPPLPTRGLVMVGATNSAEPTASSPAWAAVRGMRDESNGRLEAREVMLAAAFSAREEWSGWFESLPIPSVRAHGVHHPQVRRVLPSDVFRGLFQTAQSGGAYGGARGAAYARLHAWKSLGWLAGMGPDAACAEVARVAERCRWYSYESDWFYQVAWDLGMICVRPDGMTVAALAATDTE
jgi:uncharacterized protein (TIGR02996 family)